MQTVCMSYAPNLQLVSDTVNSDVVAALIKFGQMTQGDIAELLDVDPAQVTRRMQGKTRWSTRDLARIAHHMQVPLEVFYLTTEQALIRLTQSNNGRSPDGGPDESLWAPRDSNPEPAD